MTTFQLLAAPDDLFGLEAALAETPVAFAAPEAAAEPEPAVWRVDLEGDLDQAARQLEAGLEQMTAAAAALGAAEARLQALGGPVSFAAGEWPEPERAAQAALDRLRAPVAFAAGADEDDSARERFAAVLQRLAEAARYAAVIETRVGGRLAARTRLTWSADAETFWPAVPAGPDLLAVHARTLQLSLAARAALLRVLLAAARGAVKLAATLALPGGPLLALPVAWQFINQVLAAARAASAQRQDLQTSLQGA